jgi:outer membrane receptor for ferrienterochelin and colicins
MNVSMDKWFCSSRKIAVVLLWLTLCVPLTLTATESTTTTCTLEGQVVGQEGEALPGVEVKILELDVTAKTDESGRFVFEGLKPGKVTVEAMEEGHFPSYPTEVELGGSAVSVMDIMLARKFVVQESVVVTGTRTEEYISQVPVRTELLQQEVCIRRANLNLAEALTATIPGVRVEADCQNCGFTQVRLSGLEGKYTQILEDGMPTFSGVSMVYGLEQLPVEFFEQIEVVKGGTSALYGPNAVGGVINLIRRAPTKSQYRVDLNGGAHDGEPLGTASLSGQFKRDSFGADFYFRAVGQSPVDRDGDGYTDTTKRETYAGGATFYKPLLDQNGRLSFGASGTNEFRRGGYHDFNLAPEETDLTEQIESKRTAGFARWNHTISPKTYYNLAVNFSHLSRDTYYGADFDPNAYGETENPLWVTDAAFGHQMGDHLFLTGFQYQWEHVDDRIVSYNRNFDETFTNAGFYFQDQYQATDRIVLVGGVRVDKSNTLDHFVASPRGNVKIGLNDNFNLRVGVSTGFRAPVIFEEDLHIASVGGEGLLIENAPGLEEETSLSFTAALDYVGLVNGLPFQFGVNFFNTHLDNVHVLEETDVVEGGYRQLLRVNGTGSYVRGIEGNINFQVTPDLNIRGGITFQTSQYETPEPQFGSIHYFRTPDRYGFVGLDVDMPGEVELLTSVDITGSMLVPHYAGHIEEDRLETTDPFVVWNAVVGRTLETERGSMRFYLAVDNILDEFQEDLDQGPLRDVTYFYGPLYGRRVRVGFAMIF